MGEQNKEMNHKSQTKKPPTQNENVNSRTHEDKIKAKKKSI